jgi:glucose-1-phosphate cytidylyltransferase
MVVSVSIFLWKKEGMKNRIKELRQQRGISQEDLGTRIGIRKAAISKLERGGARLTQDYMEKISAALGCAPWELISEEAAGKNRISVRNKMKVVILAGGLGTRFSEETAIKPKPMIEIGGMPILWHIMKYYASFGLNDFIICGGYKQEIIKNFFANYHLQKSTVTFDTRSNAVELHEAVTDDWRVTIVDTGENTLTGGRVKRIRPFLGPGPFCLTYGDGLCDIDIRALIHHHKKAGKIMTLSAVYPPPRFGTLEINNGLVTHFFEKRSDSERLINGGFMVAEPEFLDYIANDSTPMEKEPMERLSAEGQLAAFEHRGFWQCMDKQHDKVYLEQLWNSGKAPWKVW